MNLSSTKVIQNFTVIWLTTTNNHTNSLAQLTQLIDVIKIFTEFNRCIDYLTEVKTDKVFMIIDYIIERELLSIVDGLPQVDSIYFPKDQAIPRDLCSLVSTKVKGIFTNIESIFNLIKANIQRWNDKELTISSITSTDILSNDSNQLDSSFMYSQLMKEILLELEYNDTAKSELAEYCRQLQSCGGTQNVSSIIDEFERDYDKHTPIWWYSRDCFAYVMLNRALRLQDVKTLIKIGFFLRDVHQRIKYLHSEKSLNQFTVYRGQCMPIDEFEKKIRKNPGGLLSFNNFLSTSLNHDIAKVFADSARVGETLLGILFEMNIDMTISSTPCVEVESNDSYFGAEQEILFSMHTIFRIGEIKEIEDRLWHVKLKLTSDQDEELKILSKRIRTEIQGGRAWHRLCHLLIKMGKFNEATDVLIELLNKVPKYNWVWRGAINHQLGHINREKGNFNLALVFYNIALKYCLHTVPIDYHSLGITYNDIGELHRERGNNLQALIYYQKTLENFEESFISIDPWQFSVLYSNIGQVFQSMGEYSTALGFFEKTLAIDKVILSPNDPLFAVIYNNIGAVYSAKGDYLQALSFYKKTLHIEQRSLPDDHPSLAVTHNNLGEVYREMKDYSNALSEFDKAIDIANKSIRPDHPGIAVTYCNMGHTYVLMNGDYWMALSLYEKARQILETNGASNNPNLATVHNHIGAMYLKKGEPLCALDSVEKALEIQKQNLSPNHLSLCHTYIAMAVIYYDLHDYQQALKYLKLATEIALQNETSAGAHALEEIRTLFTNMNEQIGFRW